MLLKIIMSDKWDLLLRFSPFHIVYISFDLHLTATFITIDQ